MVGKRGSALILALGVLVVISLFATAFLGLTGIEMRIAERFAARGRAHYLARAGVKRAISQLGRGKDLDDALGENWRENGRYSRTFPGGHLYEVTWGAEVDMPPNNFSIVSTGKIKRGQRTIGRSSIKAIVERDAGEIFIKYWWED